MNRLLSSPLLALSLLASGLTAIAEDAPKPLKVLLVTGGCCHDYASQKEILKNGLEKRARIIVEHLHTDDKGTKFKFAEYEKPNWAKPYDVIIHDECTAGVNEVPFVESILNAHREGVPAVNLHCAMHCYRTGTPIWFDYIGLESSRHGAQKPIEINFVNQQHPITKGLSNWTTIKEELYNNIKIGDSTVALARGKQDAGDQPGVNDSVIAWVHEYGPKKTRVFSTSLGHNNETVGDDRYLDLVTRGVLWAAGKLGEDGKPAPGFAK